MKLTFVGATETVTGSKTLLEISNETILIDSGLFQEGDKAEVLNKELLPFDVKKLTAIIITHAHLDHTGFLPFIYQQGYRGPIYLTEATSKLARIILSDSAELMSEETNPLYSLEDAHNVVSLFRPQKFNEKFKIKNVECVFHRASHILGAATVEIIGDNKKILFSGDLGRNDDPILNPPELRSEVDYIIMESTYGASNRLARDMELEMLAIIKKIKNEKLNLLIPCFALHRAQMLAYILKKIFKENPDLKVPLYLNSPMMEKVTKVYQHNQAEFKFDFNKFNPWEELYFLNEFWDIQRVNETEGPQIILASSGMVTGGRIWTHLVDLAPKNDTLILFPGYLAKGTMGFKIANGETNLTSPTLQQFVMKAKVIQSDAFSSHAEQSELISWLNSAVNKPQIVFLNHGEEKAKSALKEKLESEIYHVIIPKKGEVINL